VKPFAGVEPNEEVPKTGPPMEEREDIVWNEIALGSVCGVAKLNRSASGCVLGRSAPPPFGLWRVLEEAWDVMHSCHGDDILPS